MRNAVQGRSRAGLACGVALGALLIATGASAQTAQTPAPSPVTSPRDTTSVAEVIVTANKREERLRDVALGITALKGDDLDRKQFLSFQDYAPLVPSLSLQSIDAARTRVTIRGENAGGQGSTVGLYIDDSPIGSSTALADGSLYAPNGDTWDLQRVEVLRGPQGTLYGANAEGGLLKFVTNPPDPTKFSGAVQAGYQGIDGGGSGGSVKGVINAPLLDGKAAVRLSAYYEDLPGFIDDTLRNQNEVNHGYREGVRFSALYKPVEDLTLKFTAFHQDVKAGAGPYVDAVGSVLTYANPPANRFDPAGADLTQQRYLATFTKATLNNAAFSVDWNAPWVEVTSITSYSETRTDNFTDESNNFGSSFGPAFFGIPFILAGEEQTVHLKKFTEELRFASRTKGPFTWQAGVFYTHEKVNFNQDLPAFLPVSLARPVSPAPSFGSDLITSAYQEVSGFGEATYKITSKWDVSAGGRYSSNNQGLNLNYNGILFTGSPTGHGAVNLDTSEDTFTYSFGSRYHFTPDSLAYARIASGYRPGGPNLVPPGVPTTGPNAYPTSYGSDSTVNYELGYRTDLFDRKVSVDVAYFYIDWSDIQVATRVNGYGVTGNAGQAQSTGVEWTFGYRPISGLTLAWTGSYVAAELTEDAPVLGGVSGKQLPYVPKLSTALDGDYRWRLFGDYDAFVGGTYAYVGTRYNDFGTQIQYEPHGMIPDYSTVALRAGVAWRNLQFQVYGRNITDERGITVYSNTGTPGNHGQIAIIQPRTIGFTLTAKL